MIKVVFFPTGKHDVPGPEVVKTCNSFREAQKYVEYLINKFGKPIDGYYHIELGN